MKLTTQNTQKLCQDLSWKITSFSRNMPEGKTPRFLRSICPMTLKLSMHILEVLTQLFTRTALPRISPGFRAINTQSDLGRTP